MKNLIKIEDIIAAHQRLKSVVTHTPLIRNYNLSKKYDCNIWLKREDMQVVRSFKIRGAYNKMASMSAEELQNGIVAASAGNHAQGVAFACSKLKVHGTIFMPMTTPNQKVRKVRKFGGKFVEVILIGDAFDDAYAKSIEYSAEKALPFIHPFNDPHVIAGQGTAAIEILHDLKDPVDYLVVAIGGGGYISGVGSYFKQISPDTKIIGVEAEGAPAMYNALQEGKPVMLDKIETFADGVAVKTVGELTHKIGAEVIDEMHLIPEGKICSTILDLYDEEAIVVEPAGAITVSALDEIKDQIKGKTVVVIISGGNNDITRTEEIRERSLLYEGRKHYFIIRFPQRAGALREFLDSLGPNDDITHFEYTKKNNRNSGPALVGIELKSADDYASLIQRMTDANITFQSINNNPTLFEMMI